MPHNKGIEFSQLCKEVGFLPLVSRARTKHGLTTVALDSTLLHENKMVLLPNETAKHLN